jgi:thiol-disulfide isomerase/thioredoxin
MRTLIATLFAAAAIGSSFAQGIEFETDWATALQRAKSEKKPMLIDFYTDWCGWCKVQDTTTWKDLNVARFANNYLVPVKLDAERDGGEVAVRFRPTGYPTVVLYDPNSSPQRALYYVGYNADASAYLAQIKEDAYSTAGAIGFQADSPNPEFPDFVRSRYSKQRVKGPSADDVEKWLNANAGAPDEVKWAVLSLSSISPQRADAVLQSADFWRGIAGASAYEGFVENQVFKRIMGAANRDELASALEFAKIHGGPEMDLNQLQAQWASRKKEWTVLLGLLESDWGAGLEVSQLNSLLWPIAEAEGLEPAVVQRAVRVFASRMTGTVDPSYRDTYAWLLFRAGKKSEAKAQAKQAIAESGGKLDSSEELLAKLK